MEVVLDGGVVDGNAEYEMNQEGSTSSSMIEDGQAMDYSALDSQPHSIVGKGGDDVYEVTMQDDSQGQMIEEQYVEGEMIDDTITNVEEEREEEMNDEVETEQEYEEELLEAAAEVDTIGETSDKYMQSSTQSNLTEEGNENVQAESSRDNEPESAETGAIEAVDDVAEKDVTPREPASSSIVEDTTYEEVPIESTTSQTEVVEEEDGGGRNEEEAAPGGADGKDDNLEGEEEEEELHAPPSVRVTFNGQDFVLFPHSEPSAYISADSAEPIAAPRLKADQSLFYESMESLLEALRVKDSLGDFLEEGTELQINLVDLQLVLREDDIYAREVSLNDLHRLHLGMGLTSSLHLTVSETPRFITRYNELAAHALAIFGQAEEQSGESVRVGLEQGKETDASEEEQGQGEEYNEEGNEEGQAIVEEAPKDGSLLQAEDGRDEEAAADVKSDTNEAENGTGTKNIHDGAETLHLNKTEVASLEASVPHQNYEEDGEEVQEEGEGEDIVAYEEVYQSDDVDGVINGDAEYEAEERTESNEEQQEEEDYHEAEDNDDVPLRSKRSLDEGDDIKSTELNVSESKRVKVDS